MYVLLDQHHLTALADQRPRSGRSKARFVETSDILYFMLYPKKSRLDQKL
jgi:hypothetical protein